MMLYDVFARAHATLREIWNGPKLTDRDRIPAGSRLALTELEDRILMSATPLALDAPTDGESLDGADSDVTHEWLESAYSTLVPGDDGLSDQPGDWLPEGLLAADQADTAERHELVIVDQAAEDFETLVDQLSHQAGEDDLLHVVLLDADADGVDQITDTLAQYESLDAVHIISHGNDAALRIGNMWLHADNLDGYAAQIAGWSDSLAEQADVLLYGCNLAESETGQTFVESLAALTGADVAASSDSTGHVSLGGDWALEFIAGSVETAIPLSVDGQSAWMHLLASGSRPVAHDDTTDVVEDIALAIDVVTNDTDADGDTLRVLDFTSPTNGLLFDNGDGSLTYTPDSEFSGSDSFQYIVTDDHDDTLAYWRLNGDADDLYGSHDGVVNGTTVVAGQFGDALQFDGDGDFVQIDDFSYDNEFTLSFWFKVDDNSGDDYQTLFSHGELYANSNLTISIGEDGSASPGHMLTMLMDDNDPFGMLPVDVNSMIGDGQWHQYTLTVSGDWGHRVYLDGDLRASDATRGGDSFDPSGDVFLGVRQVADVPLASRYYHGELDAVRIQHEPIDDTTVLDQFTGGAAQATVDVTVLPDNDAPVAVADAFATNEDIALATLAPGLLSNDFDIDNATPSNAGLTIHTVDLTGTKGIVLFAADGRFSYDPNDQFDSLVAGQQGTDTFSYTVTDGAGGFDTASVTVTIYGSNDAPVATDDLFSTDEDVDLVINTADLLSNDSDIDGDTLFITSFTQPAHGTIVDNGDSTWTYRSAQDYAGTDSFTYTVDDGSGSTRNATVNITVNAVNDQPVLNVPTDQTVEEDTLLNLPAITVSDVDAEGGELQVTLAVNNGSLTLGVTEGLTFTQGDGTLDAALTFSGTQDQLNAALATLSYQGDLHYNGPDLLTVQVNDQGNTGSGDSLADMETVSITVNAVNDQPVLNVPTDQTVDEDTLLNLPAITVSDVDAEGGELQVTLAVNNGSLTLGVTEGLTFTQGDGTLDAALTFSGTQDQLNAALATLSYQGDLHYNGPDLLTVQVNDQGNTGSGGSLADMETVNITVNAVNDQPVLNVPTDQTVDEDTLLNLPAITVSDVDAEGGELQVTLAVNNGSLTLGVTEGLTFTQGDGTLDAALTFSGTQDQLNAALATLSYQGDLHYNGPDLLTVQVNDQGNTGSGDSLADMETVSITVNAVNDQPVLNVPTDQTVDEDTLLNLPAITVSDVDAKGGELQVTLAVNNGSLTLGVTEGLTFSQGDGTLDAALTFSGTQDQLNAALATLSYQGDLHYNGPDLLTVQVNDQGNTGSGGSLADMETVNITVNAVNDQPLLNVPTDQTVDEDTLLNLPAITVSDVDAEGGELQVTLAVNNGSLTLGVTEGLTFTQGDGTLDAALTFSGTQDQLNAALATLSYQGDLHYNGPDLLTVQVNDQGNTGSGGSLADMETVNITVNAVNDQPVLNVPTDQTVDEDTLLNLPAITVSDVDAEGGELQVTLAVNNGSLTLGVTEGLTFTQGDGTLDAALTFSGTQDQLNAALATLSYQGDLHYNGPDLLTVQVNDQGNTGSGGSLADMETVNITVNAVNDQPVLNVPTDQTVDEDTLLNLPAITVSDVDAEGGELQVTLAVNNGSLTLGVTEGLTFTQGDGTLDAALTFSGTQDQLNAALATLSYQGDLHYNGPDLLTVQVNDQGNTGSGGSLADMETVNITVNAVNDQPVLNVPTDQTVDEDTLLNLPAITVSDVDAEGGELQVTLAVNNGSLTLGVTEGLTFTQGDGTLDAALTFSGTQDQLNAALATLSYQGDLHYNGPDLLTVQVNDQGNTGSGGSLADMETVNITVNAVNDQPVLNVPTDQTVDEDTLLNLPAITVSDVDAEGGELQVTLAVNNGSLTLGVTEGLTFTQGDGTLDAALTFSGTQDQLNAALATLSYQGDLHYNGPDLLTVQVNDQGNTGSGDSLADMETVSITVNAVNDQPTSNGISDVTVNEDTEFTTVNLFAAFDDVETPDSDMQLTLEHATSTDLFRRIQFDPDTGIMTLHYAANASGVSEITVRATDQEGLFVTESFRVEVIPLNDAPVANGDVYQIPGDQVLGVDSPGILKNDTDVEGDRLTVELVDLPTHGKLVIGKGGAFRYIPDPSYLGWDSFTYRASDGQDASEPARVFIKVLTPTSPVDTGADTPGTGTTGDGTTDPNADDDLQNGLGNPVSGELHELIGDTSSETHNSPLAADDRGALRSDDLADQGRSVTSVQGLGDSMDGGDTLGQRLTTRGRYTSDFDESTLDQVVHTESASVADTFLGVDTSLMWGDLDELAEAIKGDSSIHRLAFGSAVGITTGLTVGYVLWTVRAGYVLTTLIAQVPAWRVVDPLPILDSLDGQSEIGDEESLQTIIQVNESASSS